MKCSRVLGIAALLVSVRAYSQTNLYCNNGIRVQAIGIAQSDMYVECLTPETDGSKNYLVGLPAWPDGWCGPATVQFCARKQGVRINAIFVDEIFEHTTLCAPTCPGFVPSTQSWAYRVAPVGHPREVWIASDTTSTPENETPKVYYLSGNRNYKIVPKTQLDAGSGTRTVIRSDQTLASVRPNIASYEFIIAKNFCADFNMSGVIDPGDIDAYVESPVDVTDDAMIDGEDYEAVIAAVGAG